MFFSVFCVLNGRKLEEQKSWERKMEIIHLFYAHEFQICDKNWTWGVPWWLRWLNICLQLRCPGNKAHVRLPTQRESSPPSQAHACMFSLKERKEGRKSFKKLLKFRLSYYSIGKLIVTYAVSCNKASDS